MTHTAPRPQLSCVILMLALTALACTDKADACDDARTLEGDTPSAPGRTAAAVVAELAAAPTPTLAWHDPPILADALGVADITVDHAGTCTTALHVDVELRDAAPWLEPDAAHGCAPAMLVPVRITITSDDGLLELEAESVLEVDADDPGFTIALDSVPTSLAIQIGPSNSQRETQLIIDARLVDDRLTGSLRLISDDCADGSNCSYWAEHILASFE